MSLLRASEAARLLGLSQRTVYALAGAGELPCYRFGSAVRFDPADLEAYKLQCRSRATTPAAGTSNLTASSPDGASALTRYFRKAGREPRPRHSTSAKAPASSTLRLVASSDT